MEAALGQFAQVGPVAMWREMLPAGVGVGIAMAIVSAIVAIYYNVIMAYSLFYLFNSFRTVLPWTSCDPTWGADERCYLRSSNISASDLEGFCVVDDLGGCTESGPQPATEQYWERAVLDIDHEGLQVLGDLGAIKFDLAFFLLLSWLIVNVCVMKGVKSSGKVVYFTATFPYVVLLILLVRGLTLEGAGEGLRFLFIPDWNKLGDLSVWMAAAGQVFFSLGISWGGIIMFGSYNRMHDRVHIDAHIVSATDFLTSLIASIVIFSTLGHTAHNLGVPIESVAKGGQGLAFVAYPEALAQLPAPHLWCILFFSMLFLLGLDSEFALFETVLVTLYDAFPELRSKKMEVTSGISFLFFLLGIPCITQKGQYVLDIMDTYGASISVMIIAVFEMIVIMWVYGVKRFCKDVKSMLGFEPNIYFKVCWAIICPLLLMAIFLAQSYNWTKPSYGTIQYPDWAHSLGWGLAIISVIQIPLWFLIMLIVTKVRGEHLSAAWESSAAWLQRRNVSPSKPVFMSTSSKPKIEDFNSEPRCRLGKFMDVFGRDKVDQNLDNSVSSLKKVKVEEHNQALFSSFMSIQSGNTEVSSENEKTATIRAVKPAVVPNQSKSWNNSLASSIVGVRVPPPPPPPTAPFLPAVPVPIEASTPAQKKTAPYHSQVFQNVDLNADLDLPPPPPTPPSVVVEPATPNMLPPITKIISATPNVAKTSIEGELPAMNTTGPPPLARTPWDDTQSINNSVLETTVTEGYNA